MAAHTAALFMACLANAGLCSLLTWLYRWGVPLPCFSTFCTLTIVYTKKFSFTEWADAYVLHP